MNLETFTFVRWDFPLKRFLLFAGKGEVTTMPKTNGSSAGREITARNTSVSGNRKRAEEGAGAETKTSRGPRKTEARAMRRGKGARVAKRGRGVLVVVGNAGLLVEGGGASVGIKRRRGVRLLIGKVARGIGSIVKALKRTRKREAIAG